MNRLVIHKNATTKNLFRLTGSLIYKNHAWDVVSTKDDLVAYLTQFQPDVISIGPLPNLSTEEVASYLRAFYLRIKAKIPPYICNEAGKIETVKLIMKGKSPLSPVSTRECTDGKVTAV
jgi:hypothetical protein